MNVLTVKELSAHVCESHVCYAHLTTSELESRGVTQVPGTENQAKLALSQGNRMFHLLLCLLDNGLGHWHCAGLTVDLECDLGLLTASPASGSQ